MAGLFADDLKLQALPRPGATEYFDGDALASWSYDPASRVMVTYDTPANAAANVQYVQQRQLGGAMWWESSGDKKGEGSIINLVGKQRSDRLMPSLTSRRPCKDWADSRADTWTRPTTSWNILTANTTI